MLDNLQALEDELVEKFKRLDLVTKQRLLAQVDDAPQLLSDFEVWMENAKALQNELLAKYGEGHFMPVEDMVREVREERDNELLGRSGF